MTNLYILIWSVVIFIIVFMLMYYALQVVDFSKIFRANSTKQIRIIILFISAATAFSIMLGFGEILKLISLQF